MSDIAKPTLLAKLRRRLGQRSADLEETVDTAIASHEAETGAPALASDARSMMKNVIGFSDLQVSDLMVPRVTIVAVSEDTTLRGLLEKFVEAGHSRLPIFRESLDDVAGMVHVKDLIGWMNQRSKKKGVKSAVEGGFTIAAKDLSSTIADHPSMKRDVLFVPPSMPAPDLLLKMKASHIHLAIVVDEYGGTDGIVSLEDLVEEIIGDISDEHDIDEESDFLTKGEDDTYLAQAQVPIARLDEELGVDLLPDDKADEAKTLGGLVFEMLGRVPTRGEIIKHPSGAEFEILESDARRIRRVRIHVKKPMAEAAEQEAING